MRLIWSRRGQGNQNRERLGGEREFYSAVGHREPIASHHTSLITCQYPRPLHLIVPDKKRCDKSNLSDLSDLD